MTIHPAINTDDIAAAALRIARQQVLYIDGASIATSAPAPSSGIFLTTVIRRGNVDGTFFGVRRRTMVPLSAGTRDEAYTASGAGQKVQPRLQPPSKRHSIRVNACRQGKVAPTALDKVEIIWAPEFHRRWSSCAPPYCR